MDISVIIPTYQRPQLLVKCLLKLLRQDMDHDRYEIIVVTDGPDDATTSLIESMAKGSTVKMRSFSLLEKKGPAAARNLGWLNARANIIAFTDDDCLPNEHWLSTILQNMNTEGVNAIAGQVLVPRPNRPTDYEQNIAALETADFITANCACTKAALIAIGGFDERYRAAWREDSDLEFKLITNDIDILHVKEAVVVHPVRKADWGVSVREQSKGQYNALLYKKYPKLYREKIQRLPLFYYAILIAFIIMLGGFISHSRILEIAGFCGWMAFTVKFAVQRLYHTQRTARHIIEMAVTSLIIPFISIYWQWYGAFKYHVLFI